MAYAPSNWLQLPSHTAVVGLAPALSLAAPVLSSDLALSGGLLYYCVCAKWMQHQALPVQGWRLRQLLHSRPCQTSGSVHIAVRGWSSRGCTGCTLELRSLPHRQHHRDPDPIPIAPTLNITSHKYHLKVRTVNVLDISRLCPWNIKRWKHQYIDNKNLHWIPLWLGSKGRRGWHCICLLAPCTCMRGSRCPSGCSLARDWPSGLRLLVSSSSGTGRGISRRCPRTWLRPLDIRTSWLCSKFDASRLLIWTLHNFTLEKSNICFGGKTWPNTPFFPSWQGWSKARLPVELSRTPTSQMQLLCEVEPSGDLLPAGHGLHSLDE